MKRKGIIMTIAIVCTLAAITAAVLILNKATFSGGGSQVMQSPDGRFGATCTKFVQARRISGSNVIYEIAVEIEVPNGSVGVFFQEIDGQEARQDLPEMSTDEIIQWDKLSQTVTFNVKREPIIVNAVERVNDPDVLQSIKEMEEDE